MMQSMKRFAAVVAVCALGAALAGCSARASIDDEAAYLQVTDQAVPDLYPKGDSATVTYGYELCDRADDAAAWEELVSTSMPGERWTAEEASGVVEAALTYLCPEHLGLLP